MTAPQPPAGLGDEASQFWSDITSGYKLRPDELLVLRSVCREIDLLEEMESYQDHSSLISTGSQGQDVAAPMVGELRQHRALVARLVAQLKLPDETGRAADSTSAAARNAANARWSRVDKASS